MQQIQQSEATAARRRVFFQLVDATDGITAEIGQTGTGFLSKNGATPVATSGSLVELSAADMPGRYYFELTSAEADTLGILSLRFKAAATAEMVADAQIIPFDPYDAVALGLSRLDADISSRATPAQVNTEVSDVLKTDTIAELAQATPSATPTFENALMLIYMVLRNKLNTTSTLLEVHNDVGTVIAKATLSDDGTTFTRDEMVAGV